MPENLALNLGDAGLGGLTALVPMAMRRLSQGSAIEPEPRAGDAATGSKSNGADEAAPA